MFQLRAISVACIFIFLTLCNADDVEEDNLFLDDKDASMLFETSNRYEAKRLLYTGKEQRREAKEAYEEKCERKVLGIQRNKPRWCPELTQWDGWLKATNGDGLAKNAMNKPIVNPMNPMNPIRPMNPNPNIYNNPSLNPYMNGNNRPINTPFGKPMNPINPMNPMNPMNVPYRPPNMVPNQYPGNYPPNMYPPNQYPPNYQPNYNQMYPQGR